jgi:hypothetical protein
LDDELLCSFEVKRGASEWTIHTFSDFVKARSPIHSSVVMRRMRPEGASFMYQSELEEKPAIYRIAS